MTRSLGVAFWVAVVAGGYASTRISDDSENLSRQVSLARYFIGPTAHVRALDPTGRLRVHDPVFFRRGDGPWSQIGYVGSTSGRANEPIVLSWYDPDISADQCRLVAYRTSGRLEEVVATMMPPEKRLQMQQRLAAVMSTHGDELADAFVPLVQASLSQSLPVIEQEFRSAVERHRDDIDSAR